MIQTPEEIIKAAIDKYKPSHYVLMVSGGHDSVTAAHVSSKILDKMGLVHRVYHGDTTIGIPEVQEYVTDICSLYEWSLHIGRSKNPNDWYENIVAKHGFPGPTKTSHQLMYRLLKERALRHFVTHIVKSSPHSRERVMLLTGIRQDESRIRMGYSEPAHRDNSKVWVSPLFYWSEQDCKDYMRERCIPKNPVKEKICISGECLCGCFARREEFAEIKAEYPHVAKMIERIHETAKANGFPWKWGQGPKEWRKEETRKKQTDLFMCIGCESKHTVLS